MQWFWDSCFHAVILSQLDLERGCSEMRSLLANVWRMYAMSDCLFPSLPLDGHELVRASGKRVQGQYINIPCDFVALVEG
jgi:hypothetical protein